MGLEWMLRPKENTEISDKSSHIEPEEEAPAEEVYSRTLLMSLFWQKDTSLMPGLPLGVGLAWVGFSWLDYFASIVYFILNTTWTPFPVGLCTLMVKY